MGSFIAKQPNGRYCRFSSVAGTVTDWNMTEEDYIELCKKKAEKEAIDTIENYLKPFEWVGEWFEPINDTQEEFNKLVEKMENPIYDPRDYKVEISCEVDEKLDIVWYYAYCPTFDLIGDGETPQEALYEIQLVIRDVIELFLEDGKELPKPDYFNCDDYIKKGDR